MSLLRPKLPRLALIAMTLIMMGALVAAPSVSGAATVKQFTANISPTTAVGQVAGTWTEQVKNCGTPIAAPCTASSTIGLGQVRITVPSEFRPITSVTASAPGHNWTASYNSGTGIILAKAVTGSDKLASGEVVNIIFSATPTTCTTGSKQFTTTAQGSLSSSPGDVFSIVGSQPSVTLVGCGLASGGSITDPVTGQTETISGDFGGTLIVTFGGDLDCSFDDEFGDQWFDFHLPTQVNITPGPGFDPGDDPKISTSRFPTEGDDSSSYLICWAGLDTFDTRSGFPPQVVEIGGTDFFVGILPNCYNPTTEPPGINPPPCVSEQFLDLTPTPDEIVISVRMPPTDPHKR